MCRACRIRKCSTSSCPCLPPSPLKLHLVVRACWAAPPPNKPTRDAGFLSWDEETQTSDMAVTGIVAADSWLKLHWLLCCYSILYPVPSTSLDRVYWCEYTGALFIHFDFVVFVFIYHITEKLEYEKTSLRSIVIQNYFPNIMLQFLV